MAGLRPGATPYGYGSTAYNYQQQQDAERRQRQAEAESDRRFQESLAAQIASQQYQNQSQGIYNANAIAEAMNRLSSLGLNFAGDAIQRQMALLRGQGDITQLAASQRDAANRAAMDVAQTQFSRNQQQLNAQDDLSRLQYQRANNEVNGAANRWKNAYGYR